MTPYGPKVFAEPAPVPDDIVRGVHAVVVACWLYLYKVGHTYTRSAIPVPSRPFLLYVGCDHAKLAKNMVCDKAARYQPFHFFPSEDLSRGPLKRGKGNDLSCSKPFSPTPSVLAIPPQSLLHPRTATDPLLQQSQSQPKPSSASTATIDHLLRLLPMIYYRCQLPVLLLSSPSPPCKPPPPLLSALIAASPATAVVSTRCCGPTRAILLLWLLAANRTIASDCSSCSCTTTSQQSQQATPSSASPLALLLLLPPTTAPVTSISPPVTAIPLSLAVVAAFNRTLRRYRSLLPLLHLLVVPATPPCCRCCPSLLLTRLPQQPLPLSTFHLCSSLPLPPTILFLLCYQSPLLSTASSRLTLLVSSSPPIATTAHSLIQPPSSSIALHQSLEDKADLKWVASYLGSRETPKGEGRGATEEEIKVAVLKRSASAVGGFATTHLDKVKGLAEVEDVPDHGYSLWELCEVDDQARAD
ncbi:hypothetical protein BHM03_00008013 [Ensete ventricosum]|nr:hypothetical protein BHM03_00008013 [Ensete ventricosum]